MEKFLEEYFGDFELSEETDVDIKEVNGVKIPDDYLKFIRKHNGGEGNVGENAYMKLVPLEELEEFNDENDVKECMPGCFSFGTDMDGTLFMYSGKTHKYFAVDDIDLSEDNIDYEEDTFMDFVKRFDEEIL